MKTKNERMKSKLEVLLAEIINAKELAIGRLNEDSLYKAWQENRAVFIQDEACEKIIACGVLWFLNNSVEIGSLWVDSKHRGNGLCGEVLRGLIIRIPKDIRAFIVARNSFIAHLAEKHGMMEADRKYWRLVAKCPGCDLCNRLPVADRLQCSLRVFRPECRLFFFPNNSEVQS